MEGISNVRIGGAAGKPTAAVSANQRFSCVIYCRRGRRILTHGAQSASLKLRRETLFLSVCRASP